MHTSMRVATAVYALGESTSNDIASHTGLDALIVRSILSALSRRQIVTSKPEDPATAKRMLVWSISKESLAGYKNSARCDTLDSEGVIDKLEYLRNLKFLFDSEILDSIIADYEKLL